MATTVDQLIGRSPVVYRAAVLQGLFTRSADGRFRAYFVVIKLVDEDPGSLQSLRYPEAVYLEMKLEIADLGRLLTSINDGEVTLNGLSVRLRDRQDNQPDFLGEPEYHPSSGSWLGQVGWPTYYFRGQVDAKYMAGVRARTFISADQPLYPDEFSLIEHRTGFG